MRWFVAFKASRERAPSSRHTQCSPNIIMLFQSWMAPSASAEGPLGSVPGSRAWERYSTPHSLTALFTALSAKERASGADFGRVTALRGER